MDNVVTHPRFNRPPVHQPNPRKRKGTVSLRAMQAKKREEVARRELEDYRPEQQLLELTRIFKVLQASGRKTVLDVAEGLLILEYSRSLPQP